PSARSAGVWTTCSARRSCSRWASWSGWRFRCTSCGSGTVRNDLCWWPRSRHVDGCDRPVRPIDATTRGDPVSLHVLGAPLAGLVGAAPAADGAGYQSPTTQEFYQPLIGDGPFAVTRASIVILLSVALIGWFLVATTRRSAVVPGKGQWVTESVYSMVRNGLGRDIIGSHDFMRFVPMLFSMFTLILVNNLFGVIPPVDFPTMSRIG